MCVYWIFHRAWGMCIMRNGSCFVLIQKCHFFAFAVRWQIKTPSVLISTSVCQDNGIFVVQCSALLENSQRDVAIYGSMEHTYAYMTCGYIFNLCCYFFCCLDPLGWTASGFVAGPYSLLSFPSFPIHHRALKTYEVALLRLASYLIGISSYLIIKN